MEVVNVKKDSGFCATKTEPKVAIWAEEPIAGNKFAKSPRRTPKKTNPKNFLPSFSSFTSFCFGIFGFLYDKTKLLIANKPINDENNGSFKIGECRSK